MHDLNKPRGGATSILKHLEVPSLHPGIVFTPLTHGHLHKSYNPETQHTTQLRCRYFFKDHTAALRHVSIISPQAFAFFSPCSIRLGLDKTEYLDVVVVLSS